MSSCKLQKVSGVKPSHLSPPFTSLRVPIQGASLCFVTFMSALTWNGSQNNTPKILKTTLCQNYSFSLSHTTTLQANQFPVNLLSKQKNLTRLWFLFLQVLRLSSCLKVFYRMIDSAAVSY
ncbi:hypothetical protein V8G54_014199 [Vigna mungo]|uniref:Uncharacterized protein n=1 Tax=Vigna mungo TaxID=3915 RepID=A0AAQ3RVQ6_VIGMU